MDNYAAESDSDHLSGSRQSADAAAREGGSAHSVLGSPPGAPSPAPSQAEPSAAASGRDLVSAALADARRIAGARQSGGRADREQERRRRTRELNLRGRSGYTAAGPDAADPQPLKAVMRALFSERGWDRPVTEAQVFANWPALVGEDVATHCTPTALSDGQLRLRAQSSAWATQLRLMAPQILARLATQLGAGIVTSMVVTGPAGPSWRHGGRSVPGARGPRDTYG